MKFEGSHTSSIASMFHPVSLKTLPLKWTSAMKVFHVSFMASICHPFSFNTLPLEMLTFFSSPSCVLDGVHVSPLTAHYSASEIDFKASILSVFLYGLLARYSASEMDLSD